MESHNEWCKNAKEEITFSINCFNDAYFSTDEEKVQFDTISMVIMMIILCNIDSCDVNERSTPLQESLRRIMSVVPEDYYYPD